MTFLKRLALTLAVLALLPSAARAQAVGGASIAGTVKDTSGAVLPGVSVEASSPALIEKVRSVTTDASGQYKIENLRPGTYSVTFTLAGFSTIKREGIELAGTFVATINADLMVGNVSETITVTTARARSSTSRARSGSACSRQEVLDAIPAGRSHINEIVLLPGVNASQPGPRRPAGRRRHEQPPEHHVLDPRRPHERHAAAARRRPARQRALAGRVLELRARLRRDAGDDGRLRRDLGGARVRRPAHQHRAQGGRQHLTGDRSSRPA